MKQQAAAFIFVRLFSGLVKKNHLLNVLLAVMLTAGLLLGVAAEPLKAAPLTSSTDTLRTAINQFIAQQANRWQFEALKQSGNSLRASEFEQIASRLQAQDPQQVLVQAQARAVQATQAQVQAQAAVSLSKAFEDAAKEFNLPPDLLKAASYVLSGWEQRPGEPSIEGGYGLMHLVRNNSVDRLGEAARLLGVDPDRLKTDPALNIRAGAALLRQYARQYGPALANATGLVELGYVLEKWSGFPPNLAQLYIEAVFNLLRKGYSQTISSGETLSIAAQGGNLATPQVNTAFQPGTAGSSLSAARSITSAEYPGAILYPITSSNFDTSRGGVVPNSIVIGFGAGSFGSILSTYGNPAKQLSAQYVIAKDGRIWQLIPESARPFFIGSANPTYNNVNIIGVSLEGFRGEAPTAQMYATLKSLLENITSRRSTVALTCQGVVGQGTANPTFGSNPGDNFDWSRLIPGADSHCSGTVQPPPPPPPPPTNKPGRTQPVTKSGQNNYGHSLPNAQWRGEPVNPQNGNFVYVATDLSLPGNGQPFQIVRTYNSLDKNDGLFGPGWSFNLDARLIVASGGSQVSVIYPDGRGASFTRQPDGSYRPEAGFFDRLTLKADGTYNLTQTDQTVWQFRAEGYLLSTSDRNGNRTTLNYDSQNYPDAITDTAGRTYRLEYTSQGKIASISDLANRQIKYTYTAANLLETVTDPKGAVYTYSYDGQGRILSVKDGRGQTFITNQYDGAGRVSLQTDPDGKTFRFEYGNQNTRFVDQRGFSTLFEYDNRGNPVKVTDPLGGVATYQYDNNDNLVEYISPLARHWRYTSDERGNRLSETNPKGQTSRYKYDSQNNLTRMTDAKGQTSRYEYDARGNLVKWSRPDNTSVLSEYDTLGRLVKLTDPQGQPTLFGYDGAGNLTGLTNALGQLTRYEYDGLGRLTAVIDPLGRRTEQTFDAANNRTAIKDALGRLMKFEYDLENNLAALTDRAGNRSQLAYNFNNQQIELKNPLGQAVKSQYNAALYLEKQTKPTGGQVSYSYDGLNRLIGMTDARGGLTAYEYDGDGNLTRRITPDGAATIYQYDEVGRLRCTLDAVNTGFCYEYDEIGQVVSQRDGRGFVTRYEYDGLGRVLKVQHPIGQTRYEYNLNGNRVRQFDPLNRATVTEYDKLNRPVKITDPAGGLASFEYDEAGQLVKTTDVRGFSFLLTYDAGGRLVKSTDPLGHSVGMEYDGENRPTRLTDQTGKVTLYQYDPAGRLASLTDAAGKAQTFEYDPNGNLTRHTSAAGRVTLMTYNLADEMVSLTDGLGRTTRFEYETLGRVSKTTDPMGRVTEYAYDLLGRQVAVKDPKGGVTTTFYDQDTNQLVLTDALGQLTHLYYDGMNRVVKVVDKLGFPTEFNYDQAGQLLTVKKPRGGLTSFSYDQLGRPIETRDPTGAVTKMAYDAGGNLTEMTDPRGFVQKRRYDALSRPLELTDPLGGLRKQDYNERGELTKTTDPSGRTTLADYDALGRLTRLTNPLGGLQKFDYDPDGLATGQTDPMGRQTKAEYDVAGQLVRMLTPRGAEVKLDYDGAGNVKTMTDPNGQLYRFEYDALNQLSAQTDPLGRRTELVHDALSRPVAVKNPRGFVTSYGYDALDRLRSVRDAKGGDSNYEYDTEGNLVNYRDARGGVERWDYDLAGRPTGYRNQLGNAWAYTYDPSGNRVASKDANGQELKYEYDGLGRMTALRYPDSRSQTRRYDPVGNLLEMVDRDGTSQFSYDALDRMTGEQRDGRTVGAAYDAVGNLTRLTYPNGQAEQLFYNADNQLDRLLDTKGGEYKYSRDLLGRDQELSYPNGAKTLKTFDAAGQLKLLSNVAPGNRLLGKYEYSLDENGNRTTVKSLVDNQPNAQPGDDGIGGAGPRVALPKKARPGETPFDRGGTAELTSDYRYDELDRVSGEQHSNGLSINYGLDAVGNITRKQVSQSQKAGQSFNYDEVLNYDSANHLVRIDSAARNVSLGYDANGNRTSKSDGQQDTRYRYNFENQLVGVENLKGGASPDGRPRQGLAEYSFDGLGRLQATDYDKAGQSKTPKDAEVNPLYWGLQTVGQEYNGGRKDQDDQYYTLGEGGSILGTTSYERRDRTGSPTAAAPRPHSPRYLQHDGLGSPVVATNQYGRVAGSQSFGTYGQQHDDQQLDQLPNLGFTGQDYDDTTGLTHFHARWYDSDTARWLNEDPYRGQIGDPAQHNRSLYVRANPTNLTDPLGYFDQKTGRIERGDSLWSIAQQVYGDGSLWQNIYNANRDTVSNANLIYAGNYLRIPQVGSTNPSRSKGGGGSTNPGSGGNGSVCGTYTVRSGDTLSGIAAMYGVSYWDIASLSNITNPNFIITGQVVKIPCGGSGSNGGGSIGIGCGINRSCVPPPSGCGVNRSCVPPPPHGCGIDMSCVPPLPQLLDFTNWFLEELNSAFNGVVELITSFNNLPFARGKLAAYASFIILSLHPNGFGIKEEINRQVSVAAGGDAQAKLIDWKVRVGDAELTGAELGNILYGYIGTKVGFSDFELCWGAGIAKKFLGGGDCGQRPEDAAIIRKAETLYNDYGTSISLAEFNAIFGRSKNPVISGPDPYIGSPIYA